MWRFCVVIVLAAVAVSVAAATPLTTEDKVRTLAEGCATTTLNGCDLVARGVIGSGDCTFTNGTRYDRYEITVPPGKQVAFTLRALDSSYTTPALVVVPPSGEPQTPPAVYGNRAATVWIQTFTTGTWVIAATTLDLFASGRYALHVDCFDGTNPRHDCVAQELLCGQTGEGTLTAESCSFSSVPRAYVNWTIYGVEGDVLTITETSTAFSPLFGVYNELGQLLKSAQTPSSTRATATFVVPQTGWYHIDATSTVDNRGGDFTIKVECGRSGCLFPYLASDVSNVVIAYGQPATIALDLFAVGQTEARLIQDATRVATSATSQITTPPITQTKAYYVEVENACGSWLSNDFVISPDRTPRRRSVRK